MLTSCVALSGADPYIRPVLGRRHPQAFGGDAWNTRWPTAGTNKYRQIRSHPSFQPEEATHVASLEPPPEWQVIIEGYPREHQSTLPNAVPRVDNSLIMVTGHPWDSREDSTLEPDAPSDPDTEEESSEAVPSSSGLVRGGGRALDGQDSEAGDNLVSPATSLGSDPDASTAPVGEGDGGKGPENVLPAGEGASIEAGDQSMEASGGYPSRQQGYLSQGAAEVNQEAAGEQAQEAEAEVATLPLSARVEPEEDVVGGPVGTDGDSAAVVGTDPTSSEYEAVQPTGRSRDDVEEVVLPAAGSSALGEQQVEGEDAVASPDEAVDTSLPLPDWDAIEITAAIGPAEWARPRGVPEMEEEGGAARRSHARRLLEQEPSEDDTLTRKLNFLNTVMFARRRLVSVARCLIPGESQVTVRFCTASSARFNRANCTALYFAASSTLLTGQTVLFCTASFTILNRANCAVLHGLLHSFEQGETALLKYEVLAVPCSGFKHGNFHGWKLPEEERTFMVSRG